MKNVSNWKAEIDARPTGLHRAKSISFWHYNKDIGVRNYTSDLIFLTETFWVATPLLICKVKFMIARNELCQWNPLKFWFPLCKSDSPTAQGNIGNHWSLNWIKLRLKLRCRLWMESANLDSEGEVATQPAFIYSIYSAFSLNLFTRGLNTIKFSLGTLFRTFEQVVKRVLVKALHLT